eukprot:scaffold136597_cov31-Tisochrysis_lutea.AAC.1
MRAATRRARARACGCTAANRRCPLNVADFVSRFEPELSAGACIQVPEARGGSAALHETRLTAREWPAIVRTRREPRLVISHSSTSPEMEAVTSCAGRCGSQVTSLKECDECFRVCASRSTISAGWLCLKAMVRSISRPATATREPSGAMLSDVA